MELSRQSLAVLVCCDLGKERKHDGYPQGVVEFY